VIYLLLPNAEINLDLVNAQWHLAVLAFLIVVATPARHLWARITECAVIGLAVLTGPFGVLLVPIALIWYLRHRLSVTRLFIAVAGSGTVLQIAAYLLGPGRPHVVLGSSAERFAQILANRVFLAGIFAEDVNPQVVFTQVSSAGPLVAAVAICVAGLAIIGYVLWRGPLPLKLFILIAGAIFLGGLIAPLPTASGLPIWLAVVKSPSAGRYFFMADLAWILSLIWVSTRVGAKGMGPVLIAMTCGAVAWGIASEWRYPEYFDLHPRVYVSALERAKRGRVIRVPLNPIDPSRKREFVEWAKALELRARGVRVSVPVAPLGSWQMDLVAR
jgi:hypothetical protein